MLSHYTKPLLLFTEAILLNTATGLQSVETWVTWFAFCCDEQQRLCRPVSHFEVLNPSARPWGMGTMSS